MELKEKLEKVNIILQKISPDYFLNNEGLSLELVENLKNIIDDENEITFKDRTGMYTNLGYIVKVGCRIDPLDEPGVIRKLRFEQTQDTVETALKIFKAPNFKESQKLSQAFEKRTEKRLNPSLEKFKHACYLLIGGVLGLILSPIIGPAIGLSAGFRIGKSKKNTMKLLGFTFLGMAAGILGAPFIGTLYGIDKGSNKKTGYGRFGFAYLEEVSNTLISESKNKFKPR